MSDLQKLECDIREYMSRHADALEPDELRNLAWDMTCGEMLELISRCRAAEADAQARHAEIKALKAKVHDRSSEAKA